MSPELAAALEKHGVTFAPRVESPLLRAAAWLAPFLLLIGLWTWLGRRRGLGGPGAGLMAIGKSKAKVYVETGVPVRFEDVAGVDEAKAEPQEVVSSRTRSPSAGSARACRRACSSSVLVSTGAADDLSKATGIARSMVTRYGMLPELGPLAYETEPGFLPGLPQAARRLYSRRPRTTSTSRCAGWSRLRTRRRGASSRRTERSSWRGPGNSSRRRPSRTTSSRGCHGGS